VGGSKPCFTVTMGVLLSLLAGSDSIYLTAKIKKDQDEDKSLSNESSNVAKKNWVFSPEVKVSLFSSSLASFPIQTKTYATMIKHERH